MATAKLIGADDAAGSNQDASYFMLTKFTAVATGNITEFRLKAAVAGNVKCALYADNAGEPGALITAMNTGQAVAGTGWKTLSFTSTPITSGTVYWLACNVDTTGAHQSVQASSQWRYKTATYSTFSFPDPAGSGFTANDNNFMLYAGWGALVLSPSSIIQPVSYGTPTVTVGTGAQIIYPTSIVQVVAIGAPTVEVIIPPPPLPPVRKVLVTHPALKSVTVVKDGEEQVVYDNLSNLDELRIEDAIELPVAPPARLLVKTLSGEVWTFDIPP